MRTVSARSLALLLGADPLPRPAYRGLADGIRRLVSDGRLLVGTRLPSERTLTTELGLSRTTVGAALDALRDEGFVVTRRGSGSVVCLPAGPSGLALSQAGLIPTDVPPDVIDLTYAALPAAAGVTAAYERALSELPRHLATAGYHPHGLPEARAAVAAWFEGRGLPTTPEQVVMTSGAHAGLSAVLRAELEVGDRVLIESPTYPNAIVGVRRSSYRAVPTQLTPRGWDVGSIELGLRQSGARAAYLIPDHQNPTGLLMPATTRRAVGDVLRAARAVPIIDETFVELSLDPGIDEGADDGGAAAAANGQGRELPFATAAPEAYTLGSAGKTWWGGLRVGWVRAPLGSVERVIEARHSLDLGTAVLEQLVIVDLLRQGEALLVERRREARARRDAIVDALRKHVPQWRFTVPGGGLNLWCELPEDRGDDLARVAESAGVRLARGGQFGVEGGLGRFVRVPFCVAPDQADEVGRRLAAAWALALGERSTTRQVTPLIA
ncbi:GntR family transcriptional regulator [Humibacillus xanthopallidus]|uniref:GntR family transcriptional regulator n=1 Tax=Humibacillus xanthopallidus TaxID=412689 RepID=A0A543PWK6_9MICO|nr:PLP-dependent aminotransferase family protein [Humibacillus xanthopallidus]TQN48464.1 GntR family transcriptional regulator [Humibacillus xanthopallidus]